MKRYLTILLLLSSTLTYAQSTKDEIKALKERLYDLEGQVTDLTIKGLEKNFSGQFITRGDAIKTTDKLNSNEDYDLNLYKMILDIRYQTAVTNKVSFYSTLTMSKYFNTMTRQNSTDNEDPLIEFAYPYGKPQSHQLFVSRAFFDYQINNYFTASIGRFPTYSGPPSHLKDNIPRQGTYPLTAFNQMLDGMALSYNMSPGFSKRDKLNFRTIYSPIGRVNLSNPNENVKHLDKNGNTALVETQGSAYALMGEYSLSRTFLAKNANFIVYYFSYDDILPPTTIFSGSNLSSLRTDLRSKTSSISYTFSAESLLNTDFDVYGTYTKSSYTLSGDTYCSQSGFGEPPNCNGNPIGTGYGTENDTKKGDSLLIGLIYHINNKLLIGAENLHTSKYFFSQNSVNGDVTSMYGTRGSMQHGFLTYDFASNMNVRIGYYEQYVDSKIGTGTAMFDVNDETYKVTYANLRLQF